MLKMGGKDDPVHIRRIIYGSLTGLAEIVLRASGCDQEKNFTSVSNILFLLPRAMDRATPFCMLVKKTICSRDVKM
jgi:hypothetical protein